MKKKIKAKSKKKPAKKKFKKSTVRLRKISSTEKVKLSRSAYLQRAKLT